MQYRILGPSDITVSEICLGTMTWGTQNTEQEAFEQLDYARERGVNFIDTAELYPTPPSGETYGATETMIGNWLQTSKQRDNVILASKIVGRTPHIKPKGAAPHHHDKGFEWVRGGNARQNRANIQQAIDASLTRLQTDYIDLYYLHWPNRPAQRFGIRDFFDAHDDAAPENHYDDIFLETLQALNDLIVAGKIRSWGLSNETAWGVMKYLALAEKHNLAKPVALQNPYNLLQRQDETSLSEVCTRENIAYLPYSPLAAGVLSGKYLDNQWPVDARATRAGNRGRYIKPSCEYAVKEYVAIAHEYDLDPAQMALAFVRQQFFVTATIIGATSMPQLRADIASADVRLNTDMLQAIQAIHDRTPNPGA